MSEYMKPGSPEHAANSWEYCYGDYQPWAEISEGNGQPVHAVGETVLPILPDGYRHDPAVVLPGPGVCAETLVPTVWKDASGWGLLPEPHDLGDPE